MTRLHMFRVHDMTSTTDYHRIFSLLDAISSAGNKIDDYASRTDIQGYVARTYAEIGEKTRNYEHVEKALDRSNKIVYDYRRIQEQTFIAEVMARLGRKIQALNLVWRAEADARKLKDLSQKVQVTLGIARLLAQLKEHEQHEELLAKTIKLIETSTQPVLLTFVCHVNVFKFFVLFGDETRAAGIYQTLQGYLKDHDQATRYDLLQELVNGFISLSRSLPGRHVEFLTRALNVVNEHHGKEDVDSLYNLVLKHLFSVMEPGWIQANLETITTIIDRITRPRVKMEIIYHFLVKAYTGRLDLDPGFASELIQLLDGMEKDGLTPSRHVSFQVMKNHLTGMFVSPEDFYTGTEALLGQLLRNPRFRKNLPERVQQVLQSMVEFFTILHPRDLTVLEKAVEFTRQYGLKDINDAVNRTICLSFIAEGARAKDTGLLERSIDLSKHIEEIDKRIFVSIHAGDAFFDAKNPALGQDIIMGCIDEVVNVKKPMARIKARCQLAIIMVKRTYDVDGALTLLEEAYQDANLFVFKITNKTVSFAEITTHASKVHNLLHETEAKARQQKYNTLITSAKEELAGNGKENVERAVGIYEQALGYLNETTERYEHAWVTDQLDRLRAYLASMSTDKVMTIEPVIKASKDTYKVSKSDITCKQQLSWRKKRELLYQIQVTNNSRVQVTELSCRIKKHAGAFLELMHDNVQRTQVLKPGGTFACEFNFVAKRDIVPSTAIEADVSFFDLITETTLTIDLDKPATTAGFRFFAPKSVAVGKLDRTKQRMEKKVHEFHLPFNVYITWKKIVAMARTIPFKVIQREYNEIANQFFGVMRLYAESRWARKKNDTIIQIITSGDADENESNVKMEIFCDPTIFYNLANIVQEQIEVFTCPHHGCGAPIDPSQIKAEEHGACKYCSGLFYVEANVKKADKPLKIHAVRLDELVKDEDALALIGKKAKELKKDEDALAAFINTMPEDHREEILKVVQGDVKLKDFLASGMARGGDTFVRAILLS